MQQSVEARHDGGGLPRAVAARMELTKPGITFFLVLVSAVGFLVSIQGAPGAAALPTLLVLVVAVGATVGGAAALNHLKEEGLDGRMLRTRGRPLPSGRLSRAEAVAIAVGLSGTGLGLSAVFLPWTTTLILALGHAGYVLVYTPLKRITPLCTPVGALPGALPALAGCAAGGAALGASAWSFYGAVVLWQIPHFLAIGWMYREDYARAGFRVLPVVDPGGRRTGVWAAASALLLVPLSLVPLVGQAGQAGQTGQAGHVGGVVGVALTAALGLLYLQRSVAFLIRPGDRTARRLFFLSIAWIPAYLAILLLAELPWPW